MPLSSLTVLYEKAPAKINLTLRVLSKRQDGFHALHSLVMFADYGDVLTLAPAAHDTLPSLALVGEMADTLSTTPDNLVLRAAHQFHVVFPDTRSGAFTLTKNLPVASGIGGGSSDAAAALRLLATLNGIAHDDPRLYALAAELGSDVPVCLMPRAQWMSGRGETLAPLDAAPRFAAVLVNPRVEVPTGSVFKAWKAQEGSTIPQQPQGFADKAALLAYLDAHPNDLEIPACSLEPVIDDALQAVRKTPDCLFACMSGSGATVFGLYADNTAAEQAALYLKTQYPAWWVMPTVIG